LSFNTSPRLVGRGQLPNYNATSAAALAEEQRLAYVALSRAEDSLLITWSRGVTIRAIPTDRPRAISRRLNGYREIEQRNAPLTGEARKARLAAIRRELEERQRR